MTMRLAATFCIVFCVGSVSGGADAPPMVNESARQIPVAFQVDVVVVGGGTGAVSAAVAAAESGARVFLAAPYPYLGDDMTATLRLWLEDGEVPTSTLAKRIFLDPLRSQLADFPPGKLPSPRPLHVKKTLDEALLHSGVSFLYSCCATDVLRNRAGEPCGIVMANRAGRQAVLAKTIIDATDRATVARLADAQFYPCPTGLRTFKRVVIGGEVRSGRDVSARVILPPFKAPDSDETETPGGVFPVLEYTLQLPVSDGSYASWAAADQQARNLTYHPQQQFTSDQLFEVPPDPLYGRQSAAGPWQGVEKLPLAAFQPRGVPHLFVLGGCADVSRQQAEKLLRPLALIEMGRRVGQAAAAEAKSLPPPSDVRLPGEPAAQPLATGEVREPLQGVRPGQQLPTIPQDRRALPVLGSYDVVVVGGGTAGAPAGIAAAAAGAKTLVVEYLHGLGGVGTMGAISKYYWGNRVGFTATVEGGRDAWPIEQRKHWWRRKLLAAGAEIWFGTIGCGALIRDHRVIGVVVATPQCRGVVLAKTVIDATGNADVAAAAGAKCLYTDESEFAMQGAGLPPRILGASYTNTDFTIADETDMLDVWHLFVYAKNKYPAAFDQGQLVDTRERRRIVGDFTISILDQMGGRTYPDSVVQTYSNFDTHGYTVDPYLLLEHPQSRGFKTYIPYRTMLPKDLDGILVVGLAISAQRDAVPLIRMQADIQNGGYAAGVAAAMAAQADVPVRKIDVRALQTQLVQLGNLPASVLADEDSYPLGDDEIARAVRHLPDGPPAAAVILVHPRKALPLLRQSYARADARHKLPYARALAVMGDATGLDTLLAEVRKAPGWDRGWDYRGMGQFGTALSPLDSLIIAIGRTRNSRGLPVILEKLQLLDSQHDFSHHRACGLALELMADPAAARPLADLLGKPGISGHAHTSLEVASKRETAGGTSGVQTRRDSLRELILARALFRCGDYHQLGSKILQAYAQDLRGHLARHAQAILQRSKTEKQP